MKRVTEYRHANEDSRPVPDRGLSRKEVARLTGLTVSYLANKAVAGQGPPFRKITPGRRGKVVYLESEVVAWLRSLPQHGGLKGVGRA